MPIFHYSTTPWHSIAAKPVISDLAQRTRFSVLEEKFRIWVDEYKPNPGMFAMMLGCAGIRAHAQANQLEIDRIVFCWKTLPNFADWIVVHRFLRSRLTDNRFHLFQFFQRDVA